MSAAGSSIPRGTWLTLSPSVPGVTFNPSSLSVAWYEDIQEAGFRFRAELEAANKSAFGWVNVCAGAVPIAQGKPAAPAAAESAPAPTLPVVASVVPLLPAASLGVVAQIREMSVRPCLSSRRSQASDGSGAVEIGFSRR
jgi:hypothetical protein